MLAFVAQWLVVVPALLVIAAIAARRNWKLDLAEAAAAGILTVAFVKIAAALFVESRPFVAHHLQPLVARAPDNSFPSDHLSACGLAFGYLFVRSRAMAMLAILIAGIIAYARVRALLHWPADVAAGFLIGAAAAWSARFIVLEIARRRRPRQQTR